MVDQSSMSRVSSIQTSLGTSQKVYQYKFEENTDGKNKPLV